MKVNRFFCALMVTVAVTGCSSSGHRAPIQERGETGRNMDSASRNSPHEKDWRPATLTVQKGDTLYSIALNYGFDYHELAELNGIKDPGIISIGQEIRLFSNKSKVVAPVVVESKPIQSLLKDQPLLVKYPYSEAAMAKIDKVQTTAYAVDTTVVATAEIKPKPEAKPEAGSDGNSDEGDDGALEWSMPAQGKLVAQFSEAANRKGIDIAGKLGQPITASAAGKVVYSGNGLRGYGKLIIIKHNKTYLSAYAHNNRILVKEGQVVTRGQKIAEMGSTDTDGVKLHFEVRRFGKPVDPTKYLPLGKS